MHFCYLLNQQCLVGTYLFIWNRTKLHWHRDILNRVAKLNAIQVRIFNWALNFSEVIKNSQLFIVFQSQLDIGWAADNSHKLIDDTFGILNAVADVQTGEMFSQIAFDISSQCLVHISYAHIHQRIIVLWKRFVVYVNIQKWHIAEHQALKQTKTKFVKIVQISIGSMHCWEK